MLAAAVALATSLVVRVSTGSRVEADLIAGSGSHPGPRQVLAWGGNYFGEIGDGTTSGTPVDFPQVVRIYPPSVSDPPDPVAVAEGWSASFAVMPDPDHRSDPRYNRVWAWGLDLDQSLPLGAPAQDNCPTNNGPVPCDRTPTQVVTKDGTPLIGIVSVAAGQHIILALSAAGTVYSWGCEFASDGGHTVSLGNEEDLTPVYGGSPRSVQSYCRDFPLPISGLTPIRSISTSSEWGFSLAVGRDGFLWAWGTQGADANTLGQGTTQGISGAPVKVLNHDATGYLTHVLAADAGADHALAIESDNPALPASNVLWAWGGENTWGQLGDGTWDEDVDLPRQVMTDAAGTIPFLGAVSIKAGVGSSGAVKSDGTVWDWGFAVQADGTPNDPRCGCKATPRQVLGPGGVGVLTGAVSLVGDPRGTGCGGTVMGDGTVDLWGDNTSACLAADPTAVPGSQFPRVASGISGAVAAAVQGTGLAIADGPPPKPSPNSSASPSPTSSASPANIPYPQPGIPPSHPAPPGGVTATSPVLQGGPVGSAPAGAHAGKGPAPPITSGPPHAAPGGSTVASHASGPVSANSPVTGSASAPGSSSMASHVVSPGSAPLAGAAAAPGTGQSVPFAADSSRTAGAEEYGMLRHSDSSGAVVVVESMTMAALMAVALCVGSMVRDRRRPDPRAATCTASVETGCSRGVL